MKVRLTTKGKEHPQSDLFSIDQAQRMLQISKSWQLDDKGFRLEEGKLFPVVPKKTKPKAVKE